MLIKTVIRVERDDMTRMERFEEALNLVGLGQSPKVEREERTPFMKAVGNMRGNAFTLDDLNVVIEGIKERARELKRPREVFTDEKLNAGFASAVHATADQAVRTIEAFRERLFEDIEELQYVK